MDDATKKEIRQAVEDAFSAQVVDKRYIDVSRIPLICQSINQIASDIKDIKECVITKPEFWPIKALVYGITGLMLSGVVVALLAVVLNK